ncbi:hypothetical protein ACU6RQ_02275 [Zobellella denitrificans]
MPWFSALALLLYLGLLCSPPAPVVAAPSLLAAEQHAQVVNPPAGQVLFLQEQEGSDDPEPALPFQSHRQPWPWLAQQLPVAPATPPYFLTEHQVRAPPLSVPNPRHRDQPA